VAYVRKNPGRLNYGSGGNGSAGHLAGEMFKSQAQVFAVHIPYAGGPPAQLALVAGQVDFNFDNLAAASANIKSGKLKALAVTTARRSAALPDVPTVAEAGFPDFEVTSWFGLAGPAGISKEIVSRLNAEITAINKQPAVRESLAQKGLNPWSSTPEQFAQRIKADSAKYGQVVKSAQIKFD
jgi:tripartite-type tricarboxylate transporter receptor subunit TctC